jgi:hypothetical protein
MKDEEGSASSLIPRRKNTPRFYPTLLTSSKNRLLIPGRRKKYFSP